MLTPPYIKSLNYYNVTIGLRLWDSGTVYAIVVPAPGHANQTNGTAASNSSATLTRQSVLQSGGSGVQQQQFTLNSQNSSGSTMKAPFSSQIYMGVDQSNTPIGAYQRQQAAASGTNEVLIFFDDLKESTQYTAFFTAAAALPYANPVSLYEDF